MIRPHLEAKVTVEQVDNIQPTDDTQSVVVVRVKGRRRDNGDRHTVTWLDVNDVAKTIEAQLDGRTVQTARCGCYRGGGAHSVNSGRCVHTMIYTRPERHGICDSCWDHCGHDKVAGV